MATTSGRLALRAVTFRAMGTDVGITVPDAVPVTVTDRVRVLFDTWERALTRFSDDSELARLNAAPGLPFQASPLLFGVMQAALRAARATDGLYDPALGIQICALGYERPFGSLPRHSAPPVAPHPGGTWRRIALDGDARTITIPRGTAVDLGGIAKGMAVDAGVGILRNAGASSAMVAAGGDLRVIGRPPAHPYWGVELEEEDRRVVALHRGAIATSSTSKRRWGAPHDERHHLLDPATGLPAHRGTRAVTVAARTCAQAEVAAKAALVAGPLAGADVLRRLGLDAIVYPDHGAPIVIGEWPDRDPPWT